MVFIWALTEEYIINIMNEKLNIKYILKTSLPVWIKHFTVKAFKIFLHSIKIKKLELK